MVNPLWGTLILALGLQELDRRRGGALARAGHRALVHPAAPFVVGLVSTVVVALVWGSLSAPGAYHDERAYIFQARLLAGFSWTAPTPPVPMAWEMAHLFVEPAIFAKYPPGHALVLTPGLWVGLPALIPSLLAGLAGGLLFALVRRCTDGWSALLAWLFWASTAETASWHATYFSETTTTVLFLTSLLALRAWTERERGGLLVLIIACLAWIGITRPVTGMALALPILGTLGYFAYRRRSLPGWQRATLVGVLICAIIPYWNWTTTGSALTLPYSSYSAEYFPFDMPGFVRDESPPRRQLPPDLQALAVATRATYQDHRPELIPIAFKARISYLVRSSLPPTVTPLLLLIPVGMAVAGLGPTLLLGASFLLLLIVHLVMPHEPRWTIYYLEVLSIIPMFVAVGLVASTRWLHRVALARVRGGRFLPSVAAVTVAVALTLPLTLFSSWGRMLSGRAVFRVRQALAQELIAALPDPYAVIYVRRDAPLSPHTAVLDILGDPATTSTWIVRDLGDSLDAELLSRAKGRKPLLLLESSMTLLPFEIHPRHSEP